MRDETAAPLFPTFYRLRDWFAGQALIALLSDEKSVQEIDAIAAAQKVPFKHALAVAAYAMADEMMEAREL